MRDVRGVKAVTQVLSVLLIVVGAGLAVAFLADVISEANRDVSPETGGLSDDFASANLTLGFIGIPMLALGGVLAQFAFLGELSRYVSREVGPSVRSILGGVADTSVACGTCGRPNGKGSKFCNDCGAALVATCPSCAAPNEGEAHFCASCGKRLRP